MKISKPRHRLSALAFAAVVCVCAIAQAEPTKGTIEGRVVAAQGGAALSGARVQLLPGGPAALTDAGGGFRFAGVRAGRWTLQAAHKGMVTAVQQIALRPGGSVSVVIRMRQQRDRSRDGARAEVEEAKARGDRRVEKAAASPRASRPMKAKRFMAYGSVGVSGHGYGGGGAAARGAYRVAAPTMMAVARPAEMGPPPGDREGYDAIVENAFRAVKDAPLSTFSIDVDTAAYANVRRFIDQHRLPPADAVRIEEMINYFPYSYAGPTDAHPFAVHAQVSVAPWNPAHRLARIAVQGRRVEVASLPASNLVFLLDVSGSMHSPDKLPLLKRSLALLVQELRPEDSVAITVYAGAAGLVLPPTSGADKGTILAALDALQAGGSTAGGAGIKLAYEVARKRFLEGGNNRVILATDGDFNVGQSSDGELVRMIEQERKSGIYLTVLGFGSGNYQDAKMQKLADTGNGNHAYIDSLLEAKKVLVSEMGGTLLTIAKDVKIQVEFNPAHVKGYRLVGYENRMLKARDFNDDKKDAGELGAGHSVTALYEILPAGSSEPLVAVDRLKYQAVAPTPAADSGELMTVKLRYKPPRSDKSLLIVHPVRDQHLPLAQTDADFRFATAVAELGLLLRDSSFKARASYTQVIERARAALGEDKGGYRYDFVKLAEKAAALRRAAVR